MTCYVQRLSTVENSVAAVVDDRLAAIGQVGRRSPGRLAPASRAWGPCSRLQGGTMAPSDSVLQSLDFRNALKTIGSGNVRVFSVVSYR